MKKLILTILSVTLFTLIPLAQGKTLKGLKFAGPGIYKDYTIYLPSPGFNFIRIEEASENTFDLNEVDAGYRVILPDPTIIIKYTYLTPKVKTPSSEADSSLTKERNIRISTNGCEFSTYINDDGFFDVTRYHLSIDKEKKEGESSAE